VASVALIGIPDDKWGEAMHPVIPARAGVSIGANELARLVQDRKGPVPTPKSVDFVDVLPLTTVGKVDKKALRAPCWATQQRQAH
jgi:fatty-acyl-CoA synthase